MLRNVTMALAFGLFLVAAPARAEWVHFENTLAGKGVTVNYNGVNRSVFAGQYIAHLYEDQARTQLISDFYSFCVDFDHSMVRGQVFEVDIVSTDTLSHGAEVAYLYNKYGIDLISSNTVAAALQLAIWELVIDGGTGFNTGNFKYTTAGTTFTKANDFLAEALGQDDESSWLDASPSGMASNRGQSILYPEHAPEPSSALMLAVGGIGLWWRRRRRS